MWVRFEGIRITACGEPRETKVKQVWNIEAKQKAGWSNDARAKQSGRIWIFASIEKNTKRKKKHF